jgi:hypothetical protein
MKIQSVQQIGSPTIADYYMDAKTKVGNTISNYSQKELLGMKTDELTEYLYQEHALSPLLIDETRQIEWEEVGQYTELCGKSESGILELALRCQHKLPGGYQWLTHRTIAKPS